MKAKKSGIAFLAAFALIAVSSYSSDSRYSDEDCLRCHAKPNLFQILEDGTLRTLYVDREEWTEDVHHKARLTCVDCHIHANPSLHFREGFIDANCETCHRIEAEEYRRNLHFEFKPLAPDRILPDCYDCHTKHHVLKLDNPRASIHENNLEKTCGECHPEVMIGDLLSGTSLGKISGHRKGDISESFDMDVCISCHRPQHSTTRVAQDFCIRCHDADEKTGFVTGPTHLSSRKWREWNYIGGGLVLFLFLGTAFFTGYRRRKNIKDKFRDWLKSMEKDDLKNERTPASEKQEPRESSGSSEIGQD